MVCAPAASPSHRRRWHRQSLALLPQIVTHARVAFRHLKPKARAEMVQEVVCNALQAFARLDFLAFGKECGLGRKADGTEELPATFRTSRRSVMSTLTVNRAPFSYQVTEIVSEKPRAARSGKPGADEGAGRYQLRGRAAIAVEIAGFHGV